MKALAQYLSVQTLFTTAALAGTKTTVALDLANIVANMITMKFGAYTDGSFTVTAQESADNTTYTAVSASDLVYSNTTQTSLATINAANTTPIKFSYIGKLRYFQLVFTATTATGGILADIQGIVQWRKTPVNP